MLDLAYGEYKITLGLGYRVGASQLEATPKTITAQVIQGTDGGSSARDGAADRGSNPGGNGGGGCGCRVADRPGRGALGLVLGVALLVALRHRRRRR